MLKNRFVYAVLCYLLAVILALVGIPFLLSKTYGTKSAVYVIEPIAKGEQMTRENVGSVLVGDLNLPSDLADSLEDVIGRYATVDMVTGDFVLLSKISQIPFDGDTLPEELPEGTKAVSLSVKIMAGSIVEELKSGDIIKLYYNTDQLREIPELQFMQVVSAVSNDKEYIITVLATEVQTEKMENMKRNGEIYAALISRDNEILAKDLLKQQQYYITAKEN